MRMRESSKNRRDRELNYFFRFFSITIALWLINGIRKA